MGVKERSPGAKLLTVEIEAARVFLGGAFTDKEVEELGSMTPAQLMQEAQLLGSALALRQQRETADHVHELISLERASRSPKKGPFAS